MAESYQTGLSGQEQFKVPTKLEKPGGGKAHALSDVDIGSTNLHDIERNEKQISTAGFGLVVGEVTFEAARHLHNCTCSTM